MPEEKKFKDDCPHYESPEHIQEHEPGTDVPLDKDGNEYHWCGDKGEWIKQCDDPCDRYNLLKNED